MSVYIPENFVQQYKLNVEMLLQQKGSRLREAVTVESCQGKLARVKSQIGEVTAQTRTTRHADTPLIDVPHKARWISPTFKEFGAMVDDEDVLKTIQDFDNPYAQAGAAAIGRAYDNEIISKALGAALTGENGTTSTAFDTTNQQIAVGGTGLTVAKLREALKILRSNEVDIKNDPLFCAVTAQQMDDLLATTEVGSYEYNSVKALVHGDFNTFMGFTFIHTELLGLDGSSDRRVICWAKSGICLGIWDDLEVRISERADKGYNTQVYVKSMFGATRTQEGKVVEIICDE